MLMDPYKELIEKLLNELQPVSRRLLLQMFAFALHEAFYFYPSCYLKELEPCGHYVRWGAKTLLARFFGVHPSTVTRWLNGERKISMFYLRKIFFVLDDYNYNPWYLEKLIEFQNRPWVRPKSVFELIQPYGGYNMDFTTTLFKGRATKKKKKRRIYLAEYCCLHVDREKLKNYCLEGGEHHVGHPKASRADRQRDRR